MILVNGDSFTFGDGLTANEAPWPHLLFTDNYLNIAQSGSSNASIFRRTIEQLYLNSYSTVIIAWSGLYRIELADNYGKAKTILLRSSHNNSSTQTLITELVKNWHSEFWYFKQFLILLTNLKLHCNQLGIKFYCLNAFSDISRCYSIYTDYSKFFKTINLKLYTDHEIKREFNFLSKLMNQTEDCWILPPSQSMIKFYNKNVVSINNLHPNQLGHQLIADNLSLLLKLKLR